MNNQDSASDDEGIDPEALAKINPNRFKSVAYRLLHQHLYSQFIAKYPGSLNLGEDDKLHLVRKFFLDGYSVPPEEYAANEGIFVRLMFLFIYDLPKIGVEANTQFDSALKEVFKGQKSKKDTSFLFSNETIHKIWTGSWGGEAPAFGQSSKKKDMLARAKADELKFARYQIIQVGVDPVIFLS